MGLFTSSPIDEAIERATSEFLPNAQEDMAASFEVCDLVKGKTVSPKEAMRGLKRRLQNRNPNIQMLSLKLTDACVKNAGQHFLVEVTSREFVDTLASMIKAPDTVEITRKMTMEYFQLWALLLGDEPGLGYIKEVYQELKRYGINFPAPPQNLNKSITRTLAPPEWIDGSQCMRCRVEFSLTLRKHHCRNCGNVYCQDCSSRTSALPEFGIVEEVRICETCFVRRVEAKAQFQKSVPLAVAQPVKEESAPSEVDSDLALAIKLSLEEAKTREQMARAPLPKVPPSISAPSHEQDEEEMLKAAIEASLRETSAGSLPIQQLELLTGIDRENVKLFAQLIDKLTLSGASHIEPDIEALAISMEGLKGTLKTHVNSGRASPELAGVLATLEISLAKYNLLKQAVQRPPPAQHPYYPPQQPYYQSQPLAMPSMPAYPPPTQTANNPPEGTLLDDEPLIKL